MPRKKIAVCNLEHCREVAERKAAEAALRTSQERMHLLFESQLLGMAITSPEHGWIQVNGKICEMLGYTEQELAALSWAELTYPDDFAVDATQLERLVNGQVDSYTQEKRLVRKDGNLIFTKLSVSCVRRADQSLDYLLVLLEDITERKRMEIQAQSHLRFLENMDRINRAIQDSNDLQTAMNDVLDTVIAIFDCDRAFLVYPCEPDAESWSVPMERTRHEYPGVHALGLVVPMDADGATTLRILLGSDSPVTFGPENQHPLPREISEQFSIQSQMSMVIYPKGDKPYLFGIHQCSHARVWTADEKKLYQEIGRRLGDRLTSLLAYRDIREREQKFRALAENLPDNIARYDLQARLIYMNHRFELTFGVRAREWLGKKPKEIYPCKELDDYQAKIEAVIRTGKRDEMDLVMPDWIEGLRYHHIRFAAEYGPDGEIIGALAITSNVSKKRQLELELIRREREFRTLAENSPDIIVRYGRDCRRTYINRAYEVSFNATQAEAFGKTPQEYWRLTVPDAEEYTEILRRVMKTRQQERIEVQLVDANGLLRNLSMHLVPELTRKNEVVSVLSVGTDITDLKTAEQRRLEAREDERKLIARELHDDLGQRLTAVRLDIALLERRFGDGDPELLAKIRDMDYAMGETIQVIRNLLNMLRPAILDLGLVSALEWLVHEWRKRTNVECSVRLPEKKLTLNDAQSMAIFRIVQESLTNIAKHAQAKKVSIALTKDDNGYLLEIQDDGKGFDLNTSKKKGSFGLKGIEERVRMLGGTLIIESAPGNGGKFTAYLPQ